MSIIKRGNANIKLTTGHYQIVAKIINSIPDAAMRQTVADHFATEFNRRSTVFDPYTWGRLTGGKVAPNSAAR
jgi:hypothetical protein